MLPGTTWPFRGPRDSVMFYEVKRLALRLSWDFYKQDLQPSCSDALEYDSDFDPSPLCSLLPGTRALHTGDSRPPEAGSGNLPPPVAGAADHRVEQPLDPPAPHLQWPAASSRDPPGTPQHRHHTSAVDLSACADPELRHAAALCCSSSSFLFLAWLLCPAHSLGLMLS